MQFATVLKALAVSALCLGLVTANPINNCGGCDTGCNACSAPAPAPAPVIKYISKPVSYQAPAPVAAPCESGPVYYESAPAPMYYNGPAPVAAAPAYQAADCGCNAGSYAAPAPAPAPCGGASYSGSASGCAVCGAPQTTYRTKNIIHKSVRYVPQTVYTSKPVTEYTTCQTCQKPAEVCGCGSSGSSYGASSGSSYGASSGSY